MLIIGHQYPSRYFQQRHSPIVIADLDDRVHMYPCLLEVLRKITRIPDCFQSPEYGTPGFPLVDESTGIRTLYTGIRASHDK